VRGSSVVRLYGGGDADGLTARGALGGLPLTSPYAPPLPSGRTARPGPPKKVQKSSGRHVENP
jgi:hypothetical protein